MNNLSIFYSWQSDRPGKLTRNFIERALERAIRKVSLELHLTLNLDQDARGKSGSPKIPDTIQTKIRKAAVMVADLSIVAEREKEGGLPNGCVSIEWGWGEEALGGDALIAVMNTVYGGPDKLPVDIRQNLVRATYAVDEGSSDETIKVERENLTIKLAIAIEKAIRARFFYGFHKDAPRVVRCLLENSTNVPPENILSTSELSGSLRIPEASMLAVAEDLIRYGFATEFGQTEASLMFRLLLSFYVHFDPLCMPWNADQDAVKLAEELINRNGQERVDQLSQVLGWEPRRINPAVFRLLQGRFANTTDEVPGSSPFYRVELSANMSTRALAEGRASLPPVAPRAQFQAR